VADPHGRYPAPAERAVWSLVSLAGVAPGDIALFAAGELLLPVRVRLEHQGVGIVRIAPFPGHAYSNRLNAPSCLADCCGGRAYGEVVLFDCDVIAVEPPSDLERWPTAKADINAGAIVVAAPLLSEHDRSPAVLHHHRNVDESGRLRGVGNLLRANEVFRSVSAALASAGMFERWVGVP